MSSSERAWGGGGRRAGIAALVIGLGVLSAAPVRAGDFMDTRLTWTFGDDDVMADAGEVVPDSPKPGIGDRTGYQMFMDNLNTKTKGRESLTHIALYKKLPGFFTGLTTEAAVVMKIDLGALTANSNPRLTDVLMDDGSYLRASWTWDLEHPDRNFLGVTFFPFDTERFRLGYLWDISWGGGNIFSTRRVGPAPGVKVEVNAGPVNAYVGLKTAKVSQVIALNQGTTDVEEQTVQEFNYGVLGGVGYDFTDWGRVDVGAGWFQQGNFSENGLVGSKVYTVGLSGRLSFHQGIPIQSSIDYMLYRNDPNINVMDWWHEKYEPGRFSWSTSVEFTYLWQRLQDAQVFGTTKMQGAYAGAWQGRIKWGFLRAQAVFLIRNLEFILQNVPSLTPFVALPSAGISTTPEYFGAITADYYFTGPHLMPYITGGVQLPASYTSGGQTQVVRDQTRRDRLPDGYGVVPVYQVRAGVQWDLSDFMSLLANIQFVRDENLTRMKIDANGQRREFQRPNQLGFNLMARARF